MNGGKGQGGLGVDAGHIREKDPRLSFLARVQHDVQSGRELQDRGRRCPAVLSGLLRPNDVYRAHMHDLHQHVKRVAVPAEGGRECRGLLRVALQLSLFDAAAAPPDLMHWPEAAGRLVDVHVAICAGSVLFHQPAQLDEQPVRVGVLLLKGRGDL